MDLIVVFERNVWIEVVILIEGEGKGDINDDSDIGHINDDSNTGELN